MILECLSCGFSKQFDRLTISLRARHGGLRCERCDRLLTKAPKEYRSDDHLRSAAQERRAARRFGGKVQAASGALPGLKADVRQKGSMRMECKLTRKDSYSVNVHTMATLEKQATLGEDPVLEIEFQGIAPSRRYIVMPEWLYESYRERVKACNTQSNS